MKSEFVKKLLETRQGQSVLGKLRANQAKKLDIESKAIQNLADKAEKITSAPPAPKPAGENKPDVPGDGRKRSPIFYKTDEPTTNGNATILVQDGPRKQKPAPAAPPPAPPKAKKPIQKLSASAELLRRKREGN